jgi:hypothetical protein
MERGKLIGMYRRDVVPKEGVGQFKRPLPQLQIVQSVTHRQRVKFIPVMDIQGYLGESTDPTAAAATAAAAARGW